MATPWQTFPIEFKGGLISNLSPLQHGTNAVGSATILQNLEITKTGGYSKIKGYEKFDTNVVPGEDVVLGVKVINASEALAVRSDGTQSVVYHSSGSGWTSLATAAYKGGKVRFEELDFNQGKKIIFVDSVNYPAVYDDTTNSVSYITSLSDVLGATFVAVFKNHTFYVKDSVLYFTAPQTYDNFDTGDAAGFLLMGETITGLSVFRDQLIVFCANSIKRVTGVGLSDWNVSPITDRMGCNNPDTIQEVGGDIMYVAPDGLRLLSATDRIGDFGLEIASDPISKDAETFLGSTTVFSSLVIREKAQYRIFAYSSSQRRSTARGLIATKVSSQGGSNIQWATTKGIKAYCSDSKYTSILNETILFANEDGYVYELDTGSNFDGDLIEAIYESPYMPINDPQIRKTFYKMTLYASPNGSMDLDVNIRYDFADTARVGTIQPKTFKVSSSGNAVFILGNANSVFGTSTFGGQLDNIYNNNVVGSGKTISLRIEDSSTNPSFTLDTAILEFRQNDRQ